MSATKRAVYSIRTDVLDRFNATFHGRERSCVVERMMMRAIEAEEDEIAAAAKQIESDPEFASVREVSEWADAHALDVLAHD
jgi:hypothetical protein